MNRRWGAAARERRRQIEQLPAVLSGLARALRAGSTLHTALQRVAADDSLAGRGLQHAARRVCDGSPVRDEVDRWAASLDHRDADLVRAVLNTGAATGGALAGSFDRAAATLQERADLTREISALTAQARASALLLSLAPAAFLLVTMLIDPAVLAAAVGSTERRLALLVGVVLDALGWLWMRQLTAAVDR